MPPVAPLESTQRASWIRDQLDAVRTAVREQHEGGRLTATAATRELADRTGLALTYLFQRATAGLGEGGPKLALVALGSLGRRELAPHSDLDLTLVSDAPGHRDIRAAADAFLYPLWDARLEVGHAVRSPADFAGLVAEDETVLTGALDWRPLLGPAPLLADLDAALTKALGARKVRKGMVESIEAWLADDDPSTVHRLQPDVKNGAGGLREAQRVWWASRLLWNVREWEDLRARSLAQPHDLATLLESRDTLLGIRLALHFAAGKKQDQLRFDLREDVATYLGLQAAGEHGPADEVIKILFRSARALRTSARHILARCAEAHAAHRRGRSEHVSGFRIVDGGLSLLDAEQLEREPLELLRLFRVSQQLGRPLHPRAREDVAESAPRLLTPALVGSAGASQLLLDLVTELGDDGRALGDMYELGVLERAVPELGAVSGLAQRELYHVYTVDAHLVAACRIAIRVLAGRERDLPADFADIAQRVSRPHILVLAALFHDIGKGAGGGHSEKGALLAAAAAERLGLTAEDAADLVFLVEEHLSLFRLSQRRDLEDQELIQRFAATVENSERLDLLLLLSYIDAQATGPGVWNDWKATLLRGFHARTHEALRAGAATSTLLARAKVREAELAALLAGPRERLRSHVARLRPRHLVSHAAPVLVRQLEALDAVGLARPVACAVNHDPHRTAWEIVVVGPDRPGLLADLAGELAASGVSVDAAQISGTTDGLALDTFLVGRTPGPALADPARRKALIERLEAACAGRKEYAARLLERRRAAASLASDAPLPPTRVVYDVGAATDATVVDLFAADRVGLLHDITRIIFEAGASIVLARINTEAGRAEDALYLVNAATGRPLDEHERDLLHPLLVAAASPQTLPARERPGGAAS